MGRARAWTAAAVGLVTAAGVLVAAEGPAEASTPARSCSSGAHTLSRLGDHVYPETGNGGYRSVHTDVHLVYDAVGNRFLPGNRVDLLQVATQCLTDFSLDLQRTGAAGSAGPDLTVGSVLVNGRPASFRFVQPTYPGDPKGQDDPDPRAHQAGQNATVGGPAHNALPPACTPELTASDPDGQDGQACPATKLVITPSTPVRAGAPFVVSVAYTGRPGVHVDGDGSTEGWFRSDQPAGDGGFVTTEPVGTMAWMPLNDHPSSKPTYTFIDTVTAGRTAVANGVLLATVKQPASRLFPHGSTTFVWNSAAPVASYLVENSVGAFDLSVRRASDGRRYYTVQASGLSAAQKKANLAIMDQQQDITTFQSHFNGTFPFVSDGVLVGAPTAGFEEEMQTMITFEGGTIDLDTFNHENMHQWWGDNVSEANYDMTFFKEGFATLGEYLFAARTAAASAAPHADPSTAWTSTAAGRAAFQKSLIDQFDSVYATSSGWSGIPSDPTANTLFSGSTTYTRPGTAYIALRQALGADRFDQALQYIQRAYRGSSITEPQLQAAFARFLPRACGSTLARFFTQWFDTKYPTASGATKPSITGPGLPGGGFHC